MNKKILLLVVLISTGLLFSLFLIGVVLFLFYFSTQSSGNEEYLSKMQHIQEFTPSSYQSKSGFARIMKDLKNDEYVSYKNEETGSYFFISNFEGSEYHCTGSCYCTEESERRSSLTSPVLTNGLLALFTAFSVGMAINMAKENFQNSCVEQFSDVCDRSHILSKVTDCDDDEIPPDMSNEAELDKYVHIGDMEYHRNTWSGRDYFLCAGHCAPNPKISLDQLGEIVCEDNELINNVDVAAEWNIEDIPEDWVEMVAKGVRGAMDTRSIAKMKFTKENLAAFCLAKSQELSSDKKIQVCVGGIGNMLYNERKNDVRCIRSGMNWDQLNG